MNNSPRHLIFIFADHFEPASAEVVREWTRHYNKIASQHSDSYGQKPQHTWFYWDQKPDELSILREANENGLGEVEVHLHHENDTAVTLTKKLEDRLLAYRSVGVRQSNQPLQYAFIHGHWALCNSRGGLFCGVNEELEVLQKTGCYADFTFPAWGRMQPRKKNSIYYAENNPGRSKSYDTGTDVSVGGKPSGNLMIFQGPGAASGLPERFSRIKLLRKIFDRLVISTDITYYAPATVSRFDGWIKSNVHVKRRPEWVFLKIHTHGARPKNYPAYFGPTAEKMYATLETIYNDNVLWKLHYATAREAYNIARAAEAGETGDPDCYRDYIIKPYISK